MSTWYTVAWELQLTFLVPAGTRAEALLLRPDAADLIDVLLGRALREHRRPAR